MFRPLLLSLILLVLVAGAAGAEMVAGLPLHVHEYESGAIRVWLGDHISSTATVAIPTAKGLVIIDTTGNPKVDAELRKVIARKLGRDDFVVLINTHEHLDHTGGNAVYADCAIVGHELVAEGMKMDPEDHARMVDWLTTRVAELESEIAALDAGAPEAARLKENLILNRMELEVAQSGAKLVPPTKTFADRKTLKIGDTTIELYYIGGMHSASDIAVWVPEHGLLMTGDTMADVWLTDTPGCLASFIARPGVKHDFPKLLKNWDELLAKKGDIDVLVPGHWNGELTFEGFENRVKYVAAVWETVSEEAAAGTNMNDVLAANRFADAFPELVDSPGCNAGNHNTTVIEMYAQVTDQESAAIAMYDLIAAGADEKKIRKIVAQFDAKKPDFYFLESQINGYGYRFMFEEKYEQAADLFRINVELYPESWNVYDSLGEALHAAGELPEAEAMYAKSMELNPESPTGEEALRQIRQEMSVN